MRLARSAPDGQRPRPLLAQRAQPPPHGPCCPPHLQDCVAPRPPRVQAHAPPSLPSGIPPASKAASAARFRGGAGPTPRGRPPGAATALRRRSPPPPLLACLRTASTSDGFDLACGGACGRPAPGRLRHTLASDLSLGSVGRPSRPPRLLLRCLPHLPLRPREGDQPVACAWSDPLPLPQPSATNAHDPASPDPPLCRAYVRTYVQDRDRNREREREREPPGLPVFGSRPATPDRRRLLGSNGRPC